MLSQILEADWRIALAVFDAAQSTRGESGHYDRRFLEAIHYFALHNISWRALPSKFGKWNSVCKRFWRLSRSGTVGVFFQLLADQNRTADLLEFFDSTMVCAHVSAAGAKGAKTVSQALGAHAAGSRRKFTSRPTSKAIRSTST